MKNIHAALLLLLAIVNTALGQTTQDYAVELMASVQAGPPGITLSWKLPSVGNPTYKIWRKYKQDTAWGSPIATLPYPTTAFTDTHVTVDSAYEYQVWAVTATYTAKGYIYAAIELPPTHYRGTLLLLVDSMFTDSCADGLALLMQDMRGDGWRVLRRDLGRTTPDTTIKTMIDHVFMNTGDLTAVLLVGHLAVPYSGKMAPDAHGDHVGAWPADAYYACPWGGWTDTSINDTSSIFPPNRNRPHDGKWDQVYLPTHPELQISRIDLANMPAFATTEVQRMDSYLLRDHRYKMDSLPMRRRAIVSDHFGPTTLFGPEAFAANAWRNLSPMLSRDSIKTTAAPLTTTLADSNYLWAYGCGAGNPTGAAGVGATADLTTRPVNTVFTMLCGSYFGDWNMQDNFMRAFLCAPTPALTSCWAGRPNWFLHHMALGENIGYSQLLTQNNRYERYQPGNIGAGAVHAALLGDLTLRQDYLKPAAGLNITTLPYSGARLSWSPSPDTYVDGYYVYRADSLNGRYWCISPLVSTTSFTDSIGADGYYCYMVRPVKKQNTPSGSYYNLGIGITGEATVSFPTHINTATTNTLKGINLFPNPGSTTLNISFPNGLKGVARIAISDTNGKIYRAQQLLLSGNATELSLQVAELASATYTITITTPAGSYTQRWVKM